jgi:hypothetical protein
MVNGLPALVSTLPGAEGRYASRVVTAIELDAAGRVAAVYSVLATRKLTAIASGARA